MAHADRCVARHVADRRPILARVRGEAPEVLRPQDASALLVNSGSSANLVAVSALGAPMLKDLKLKPLEKGDEVITVAAGFPTTVNPIVQNGWVPVFVDVDLTDV